MSPRTAGLDEHRASGPYRRVGTRDRIEHLEIAAHCSGRGRAREPEASSLQATICASSVARRRLREALDRSFEAAGSGQRPAATCADSTPFSALRCDVAGSSSGATATTGVGPAPGSRALEAFLSPIVLAAAELLTSPQRLKIRACAAEDCGGLVLDTSRSGRRRWCTMQSCGNRAKARRFYARSAASPEA